MAFFFGRQLLRRALGVAVLTLVVALVAPAAGAEAAYPVPWDAGALVAGGANPDSAPGANDFSCKPSAEHPRPVVLVHGLAATLGANWATVAPLLANNGFCVFGLTYGRQPGDPYNGGLTRMEESSGELQAFVDRVLAATGASQVDLVGHSEGTVMPRWYLSFRGGAPKVKRYVQFTPLWQGTNLALTGDLSALGRQLSPAFDGVIAQGFGSTCESCPEFVRGSDYLNRVNAAGPALKNIEYTGVATKYDELVSPYTSGLLDAPNVKNYVLQDVCPTDYSEHLAVAYDPIAAQIMLNALDPARARPLPCTLILPSGTPNPPYVGLGPKKSSSGIGGSCLARRSPLARRHVGRVRMNYTRSRLLRRLPVPPSRRTRDYYRYCVKGGGGHLTAVFSRRSRRGLVELVGTTAPHHGNRGVRPGSKSSTFRHAYPRRRRIAHAIYRAGPRSRLVFVISRGRVRQVAITTARLIRHPKRLRHDLRLARR